MTEVGRPLFERAPSRPDAPLRVGVLASGGGTNLQALLDASKTPAGSGYEIAIVIANVSKAGALERAEAAGVPALVVPHHSHADRASFEQALLEALVAQDVELVVLAGFMRVLTEKFLSGFPSAVLNVHPALCPAFPGLRAARQALAAGVRVTGCTVHLVDAGVDTGPILAQAPVDVMQDDDEGALQARIQRQEHRLLPAVVAAWARGEVVWSERGPQWVTTVGGHRVVTRPY